MTSSNFKNDGLLLTRAVICCQTTDRRSDIRHPNQSIQYTLLPNLRPTGVFWLCAQMQQLIIDLVEILYVAPRAVAAMIIRGWGSNRACPSGYNIGGLYSTYVSSGALLLPVSHTRIFLDVGWRLDTYSGASSRRTVAK
jgi:hypothetical protein